MTTKLGACNVEGMAKSALSANPLRKYRDSLNMTQAELAAELGISPNTLYLAECGCDEKPMEALVQYFCRKKDVSIEKIYEDYEAFRTKMRANLKNRLYDADWRFTIPFSEINRYRTSVGTRLSPIRDFRTNCLMYTKAEFCKSFLINMGLQHMFEEGEYRVTPMPIANALLECGAPEDFIRELNARSSVFYTGSSK